jgi:uncharacterized protein DUF4112
MVYLLEEMFRVPGTQLRFGLEPLLGLFPGAGDVAGLVVGVPLVVAAVRRRLPLKVILVLLVNLLLDASVGAIPVVGDAFDFIWKSQRKNLRLLEDPTAVNAVLREAGVKVGGLLAAAIVLLAILALVLGWLLHAASQGGAALG